VGTDSHILQDQKIASPAFDYTYELIEIVNFPYVTSAIDVWAVWKAALDLRRWCSERSFTCVNVLVGAISIRSNQFGHVTKNEQVKTSLVAPKIVRLAFLPGNHLVIYLGFIFAAPREVSVIETPHSPRPVVVI
jgi:hypothetical protein